MEEAAARGLSGYPAQAASSETRLRQRAEPKKGRSFVLRARLSNADIMLDHAVPTAVYTSNAERANPFVATMASMLPPLQLFQDVSALRIPRVLFIIDITIRLLQIISNTTKVSTTL